MISFNSNDYIPQLSIDCVIFGYENRKLKVLVCKLKLDGNFMMLPGGFIRQAEGIDQAAITILRDRTGLSNIYMEQFRVFGAAERSNKAVVSEVQKLKRRMEEESDFLINDEWLTKRFVSIGYYALVDISKVSPKKMEIDEFVNWYDINELPEMIIDHNEIVERALEALRKNFDDRITGYNLLPEKFTMKDLQHLYETIFDRPFARNNFQKKILGLEILERLEKKYTGAANKAPYLYTFKRI